MAKSRSKSSRRDKSKRKTEPSSAASVLQSLSRAPTQTEVESTEVLLDRAQKLFYLESSPQKALELCTIALRQSPESLDALNLAGEVNVELGDIQSAVKCFQKAVELDEDGTEDGPEKFLWLAQLCEEGGSEAIIWYERGTTIIRNWISSGKSNNERGLERKLCSALCGMAEIYMTDLCMADDAESRCENYVTEALLACPDSPEALQTLASIRISQIRLDDASAALSRSHNIWRDLEADDPQLPPYPLRLTFTRLLIECEMYEEAMEVLERLQEEDDQVVDLWYLGGWCLYQMGLKSKEQEASGTAEVTNGKMIDDGEEDDVETWQESWKSSRDWLHNCERLYRALEWEDEGIATHASELLAAITAELGAHVEEAEEDDDDEEGDGDVEGEEWEDEEDDEEMKD